jgi:F-type H+-transporting ATPase subunit b
MDDRESSIRDRLDEAQHKQDEADRKARKADEQHAAIERQREDLLSEAREDAEKRRKELMAEARQRVERSEAEWRNDLKRQKEQLRDELRRRAGRHAIRAGRRLVADLADADLESQVVKVFQKRLRDIDKSTAKALGGALEDSNGEAKIVSAFALSDEQQERLRRQLADLVDRDLELHFDADDSLLCGVALHAGDQRVAWSAGDYLAVLQDRLETADGH